MYSNSFEFAVDDFHFAVEEFLEDTEYMGICESLLLPVEEGIGDSFKKALNYLYKKFHAIVEAFKRWVKKVINKVKSFFTRGKKKNSREKTDALVDRAFSEDPIVVKKTPTGEQIPLSPEESRKVVEDMLEVLNTANNVDSELKKASSDENVTKEEADTVTKKADDVSKQMSELKSRVETTYLALPQRTSAGDEEFERKMRKQAYLYEWKKNKESNERYDVQTAKQANDIAEKMANENFFKFKHPEENAEPIKEFIIVVGNIETGNKGRFRFFNTPVGYAAKLILDAYYNEESKYPEVEGAKRMFSYMTQKIPKQIQEWISRMKSSAEEAKDTGELDKIFMYEPTMQNLNRCFGATKRLLKMMNKD